MWDLKRPFKSFVSGEKRQLWPFMGIAAVLHIGLIYGYAWRLSSQTDTFLQEGQPVNLIFLPALEEEKQETIPFPASSKEKGLASKTSPMMKKSALKEEAASSESFLSSPAVPSLLLKKGNPHPPYPEEARAEGWEATIIAFFTVEPDGRVRNIHIPSDAPACFKESVLKTLKQWTYYPHSYPSAYQHKVSFVFKLE